MPSAGAHGIPALYLGQPKVDGMNVLEQLRSSGNLAPFLMLTARGSKENLMSCLFAMAAG